MNLKKFLRKKAEEDAEVLITEEDRLFCRQLAEKIVESKKREKAEKENNKKGLTK